MHSSVVVEDEKEEKSRQDIRGVLYDAEGKKVFTPEVDPELRITSEPLSPDLQEVVDQHVHAACGRPIEMSRHIVRHWRMDSRKCIKKSKRKKIRNEFTLTPFVLIGAYRVLLDRLEQVPSKGGLAADNIRTASIPFSWFQRAAQGIAQYDNQNYKFPAKFKKPDRSFTDCKNLIVSEAMAMLMRPIIVNFLPPHAWSLNHHVGNVPGIQEVESLVRKSVDYDIRKYTCMFFDLRVDGHVALKPGHIKIIGNMVGPYVPDWWVQTLNKLYNCHKENTIKRLAKWIVTNDQCSSLPALLVDISLLRLDYSGLLRKHPLWAQIQQLIKSDKKKKRMGVIKPRNLPKNIDESAHLDYHRLGPVVLVTFKGPEKLKEKMRNVVALELKSGLQYDKKFINNEAFSEIQPRKAKTKAEKLERAKSEAAYEKQEKLFEIAAAGTKPTRNRARKRLQAEGRLRASQGDPSFKNIEYED